MPVDRREKVALVLPMQDDRVEAEEKPCSWLRHELRDALFLHRPATFAGRVAGPLRMTIEPVALDDALNLPGRNRLVEALPVEHLELELGVVKILLAQLPNPQFLVCRQRRGTGMQRTVAAVFEGRQMSFREPFFPEVEDFGRDMEVPACAPGIALALRVIPDQPFEPGAGGA